MGSIYISMETQTEYGAARDWSMHRNAVPTFPRLRGRADFRVVTVEAKPCGTKPNRSSIIVDDCPELILGQHLKTGGQKRVWRCAYKGKAYVMKALMVGQETRRRVRREIQVMRACASPYLPKFGPIPLRELGLKEGPKILYFLEEYIEGTPLASVYKPMPYAEVARLGLCLAEALATLATNGYLHRDVKPMNVIRKSPTHFILIDAGLALDPDGDAITMPGKVVGTRAYLSPDQITLPQKRLDIRSDFFCLGSVLYEAATGEHPFWNDETPKGDIIHNILSFECISRYGLTLTYRTPMRRSS